RSFFLAARAYPDRISPIVLALVGLGVGVVCWRGDGGARRAVVALASLSFGMYLAIALGRVQLLRTAMAGQPRYRYVAAVPIVVLACMGVQEIGRVGWLRRVPRGPLAAAALAAGIWGFARSGFRIDQNLVVRTTVEATAQGIAIAVLPHPPGETVYLENGANSKGLLGPMTSNAFFPRHTPT